MKYKTNFLKETEKRIVSFGVGQMGKQFAEIAQEKEIKISFFCDNDERKWGTTFFDIPIVSLAQLIETEEEFVFVISNKKYFREITEQLEEHGINQVYYSFFEEDLLKKGKISTLQLHEFEAEFEYYRYQNENPEAVTIPIGLGNITERCTLNCKHCFAEVPYIENPKDTPFELFKESIDHYSAYFDKIQNMHLSGGEPLMHPKIYDMIEYTAQQENIQRVRVFSNGTLLINEEKLKKIDKTKVSFYFSHYGDYSIKLEENSKLLDKLEFDYIVVDHDHWFERNTKISFCP